MREFMFIFSLLSIITLPMCSDVQVHEEVDLIVSPVYTDGVLKLTPSVIYNGEHAAIFYYDSNIARIESVKDEGEILYEYSEEDAFISDSRSVLEKEDKRDGQTIEVEVEPGVYEVEVIAEFWLQEEEGEEKNKYVHKRVQKIETKK